MSFSSNTIEASGDHSGMFSIILPTLNSREDITEFIRGVTGMLDGIANYESTMHKRIELTPGSVIAVMDSDFNHDSKYKHKFLNLIQYYEVVVGSRFLYGGGIYSQWRYYASFLYNVFIRFFLGLPIRDKLSGFFAARSETLQRLDYDHIFCGYGDYFIRFLMTIVDLRLSLIEVPVFYNNRPAGESKTMFLKKFMRYTVSVFKIRFASKSARRREGER